METLGLSSSTTKTEPIWKTWLWPDVSNEIAARTAANNAMYGSFFVAAITAGAALLRFAPFESIADAVLFFLVGAGIGKMSRVAAVLGFLLYFVNHVYAIYSGGSPGIVGTAVFLLLFTGVRATFSFHRLRNSPPSLPVEVSPPA